jgi:hypothetical protein
MAILSSKPSKLIATSTFLASISRIFSELPTLINNFRVNFIYIKFQISLHSIMSSSTKREVSNDPREIEQKHRRSSRLHRKYPGSHSRKSSTSTEAKMHKIVKSSLSTEKSKLETLYSPKKGRSKIIKSHQDSEKSNNISKSSSKMSFWGSPDLSSGIEKLFNAMNLFENSRSLIISIYMCNVKNMIHLSNLELDELSSLFSRRDLRDSNFQDTIIKVLCLGKSFLNLIKENHGLHEDDVIAENMIPTTCTEETEFLSDSNTNSLKRHYMTFYWKVCKDFLEYIEDSMSHDSLIGSTISTRSKKSVSCASHIFSTSVFSHDTKTSKVSEKANPHDFHPKNFNHAFLPKPDFEGYRNNAKKEFEENRNYVGDEEFHQEPDHPSTFMKMVKNRTRTIKIYISLFITNG